MKREQIYKALTIKERNIFSSQDSTNSIKSTDYKILDDWFKNSGLEESAQKDYITTKGYTKESFIQRLLVSKEKSYLEPDWVHTLDEIINFNGEILNYNTNVFYLGIPVEKLPFDDYFKPIVSYVVSQVISSIMCKNVITDSVLISIAESTQNQLLDITFLSLYENYKESGKNYTEFCSNLVNKSFFTEFYNNYPVLGRLTVNYVKSIIENSASMIDNFIEDFSMLFSSNLLSSLDKLEITDIQLNLGDRHQGKAVSSLTLNDHKLYYRPRSAPEFSLYNKLIEISGVKLPYIQHMNISDHCWIAEVSQIKYSSIDLDNYLFQMGNLAAVLYACGAKDMHFENIIASSDGPVPIDLETLLAPTIENKNTNAHSQAVDYLNNSPLGTGIFPITTSLGNESIEASAILGGLIPSTAEVDFIKFENNDIVLERSSIMRGSSKSLPLGTKLEDIEKGISNIIKGFEEGLQKLKFSNLEVNGLINRYREDKIRILFRPTYLYDICLKTLRHPVFMKSMLSRERFLLKLWKSNNSDIEKLDSIIIDSEVDQLLEDNIPYFTTNIDSKEITSLSFPKRLLIDSAKDRFERCFAAAINKRNYPKAVTLIRESMNAGCLVQVNNQRERNYEVEKTEFNYDIISTLIDSLYQKYVESAFISPNDISWIGFSSSQNSTSLRLAPIGDTVYDGVGGIALALAAYYRVSADESAKTLVKLCLYRLEQTIERLNSVTKYPVGAYSGLAGFVYVYTKAKRLLSEDPTYIRANETKIMKMLVDNVMNDRYLDLSSGTAGAISVVCSLIADGTWWKQETVDYVDSMVDYLLSHSSQNKNMSGIAWPSGDKGIFLGGMSHGVSGIALGIAKAAQILGKQKYAQLAINALKFDDNYLDSDLGLWQDMREESTTKMNKAFPNHWCHGAAGISAARSRMSQLICSAELVDMTEYAKECFIKAPAPDNFSLCHGGFGNSICAKLVDESLYRKLFLSTLGSLLGGKLNAGIELDISEVPGLMVGHAGVLYSLCFALDSSIPNILLLD